MEEVNNKTRIYNNEVIWFSYQPGAGGDFIMSMLFNLPESSLLWQKINRYGSGYLDASANKSIPSFYSVSVVESNKDVNTVKKYIDNTELCCISSHSSPNLIYPLLEKPDELTYIYIYPDSLAIMQYMETLSIIKNHSTLGIGRVRGFLEKLQEKTDTNFLPKMDEREIVRDNETWVINNTWFLFSLALNHIVQVDNIDINIGIESITDVFVKNINLIKNTSNIIKNEGWLNDGHHMLEKWTSGLKESYKKYEKLSFLPNTFVISYKSFFIDRKPDILKKLIDIYNADITVEEVDLKIKEYHNKNLELIETIDKELH